MPFVRLSLLQGKPPAYLKTLADTVHAALVDTFEVPHNDRFQVIHQHAPGELLFDPGYLGVERSDDLVIIHITAGRPRSTTTKQAFYRHLVQRLADAPGLRPQDVMVIIAMNGADDWSFGGGVAQMVPHA